jgi:hypothetical protein
MVSRWFRSKEAALYTSEFPSCTIRVVTGKSGIKKEKIGMSMKPRTEKDQSRCFSSGEMPFAIRVTQYTRKYIKDPFTNVIKSSERKPKDKRYRN